MPGLLWPSVCPTWVIARQQSRMWASSLTDVPLRPSFESLPFWGTSQSEGAEENGEIMLLFGNAFFLGGGGEGEGGLKGAFSVCLRPVGSSSGIGTDLQSHF